MAEIDLEAEQVVGEESEGEGSPKRGKIPKGMIIFGALVVVEAVVLFFVFGMINSDDTSATALEEEDSSQEITLDKTWALTKPIEILGVSIIDPNVHGARSDRKFTIDLVVHFRTTHEQYKALVAAAEVHEDLWKLVEYALRAHVREFMLQQGVRSLTSMESQNNLPKRVTKYLNQVTWELKGAVSKVTILKADPSRY